jgi:putative aminopeptidase FrvX
MTSAELRSDIETYSGLFGPSGHEDTVIRAFVTAVEGIGFGSTTDPLGNVTVPVRQAQPGFPTFAVTAHLDEIGFVVRSIADAGWLSLYPIGGVHDRVVAGQVLQVRSDSGELIEGHVGVKGAHVSTEVELGTVVRVEDAHVDLLLPTRAGAGPGYSGGKPRRLRGAVHPAG